jgi:zinc/manganese transport system permease protein
VLTLLVAGVGCLIVLAVIARPLLFSSVDPLVAAAAGVPVRLVSATFLLLLGVAVAGASQITGSLLVFALLVAPAATASRLTSRPAFGVGLAVLIALAVTWVGEALAFYSPYPIGFWVTSLAFAGYLLAAGGQAATAFAGRRGPSRRTAAAGTSGHAPPVAEPA